MYFYFTYFFQKIMEPTNLLNEFESPERVMATTGNRFVNYLIDIILFYIIVIIIGVMGGVSGVGLEDESNAAMIYLVTILVFFAYYVLLEGFTGKTVGKMITKTKVIKENGEKITFGDAALRTLCRFVPFEFISAFTGDRMWHDKWSKTMVIKG